MRLWPFSKKVEEKPVGKPYLAYKSGFFSTITPRVLSGWDTMSHSIDYYLKAELRPLRARSRALVRKNTYGKRYVDILQSNIVGPEGVQINAQKLLANGQPDSRGNKAVETAFKDWALNHCDFYGKASFVEQQNGAIACAAQDGEFLFEKIIGPSAGKYGFQLRPIDPELLDIDKHEPTANGEIRMGVEYNKSGQVVRYWFRERNHTGDYQSGRTYSIRAENILHCFVPKWPDQSRGLPWTHSALEATKHLEKYQEGAIVHARATANAINVLRTPEYAVEDDTQEPLDVQGRLDNAEAGETIDIGTKELVNVDPTYPHAMFDAFVKANLRSIASGLGISYHALSNDLEGVNYSSIRAGVLEDRELFKTYQNWFVRCFVRPVFEQFVESAYLSNQILLPGGRPVSGVVDDYKAASYQPRRWSWVDPQKDGAANQLAINERLKSRSQIMREQGDDPSEVWPEIAKELELMESLGVQPIAAKASKPSPQDEE